MIFVWVGEGHFPYFLHASYMGYDIRARPSPVMRTCAHRRALETINDTVVSCCVARRCRYSGPAPATHL